MRGVRRCGVHRSLHHPLNHLRADSFTPSWPRGVLQNSRYPAGGESPAPQQHRGPRDAQLPGDRVIGAAFCGGQNDAGAACDPLRRLAGPGHLLELFALVFIDLQSDGWSKHAASIPAPILLSSYFWDDTLACVLLAASLALAARQQQPTIPLHLFRSRIFAGANLLTLLLYAALGGGLFFLPFNLIQAQGYSATAAGASFLPLVLLISLLSRWAGGLADRYGARRLLAIGALVAAGGYALLAVPGVGGSFWTTFFPGVVVLGLGMAISIAPLTTTVMGSIEARFAGRASGINNAVSRTAGLLAVAGFGIAISAVFGSSLNERLRLVELPEASRIMLEEQRSRLAAATIPEELDEESHVKVREALAYALVDGFRLVMVVCVALCVAGAVVVLVLIGGPVAANGRRAAGRNSNGREQ